MPSNRPDDETERAMMAAANPKKAIKTLGAAKWAAVGGAVAGVVTGAAATTLATAAAGTTTSLAVGSAFAPFVAAIGASHVASLPVAVLLLANPIGAAIATTVLALGGAAAGYKVAKAIVEKIEPEADTSDSEKRRQ
jgi:hypothetical protein